MHLRSLLLPLAALVAGAACATAPAPAGAGTAAAQSSLRAGQTVSGHLGGSDPTMGDDSFYDLWSYRGRAGERVKVTLRSDDFDSYLAVGRMVNGRFEEIAEDDDGAGGSDAQVVLTLPESGVYAIRANTLFGGKTGAYTLALETGVTDPETPSGEVAAGAGLSSLHPSPGRIRAGQTVSGRLEQSDPTTFDGTAFDDFIYSGKAGERLAITLRSDAFDSYLQLGKVVDGRFEYIGAEDDGAGETDSLYEITLPETGDYVIRPNTLFAGHGPYTLEVRRK